MRRAQTSTLDLMIALSLLVVVGVLVASYGFQINEPPRTIADAQTLAQAIFAPYPEDWNDTSVVVPGFVVDHRLNATLFAQFSASADIQSLIGIRSEYFVNTTLGTAGAVPENASDVFTITRYAAYAGEVTPVEVVTWIE